MHIAKGMIIGPVCGAIAGTVIMLFFDPSNELSIAVAIDVVIIYSLVGSVIGWLVAGIIGNPMYLIYRRMGWNKLWHYLLGGIVCAVPFWAFWFYPFNSGHWEAYKYINTIYFFSVGAVAAVVFWWLSIRRKNAL